jgi:hypothetical protein
MRCSFWAFHVTFYFSINYATTPQNQATLLANPVWQVDCDKGGCPCVKVYRDCLDNSWFCQLASAFARREILSQDEHRAQS